jgi:hypothetical protein
MKNTGNAKMVLVVITLMYSIFASENETSKSTDANEIFNAMMQTMPKEIKAKVDSASVSQKSQMTIPSGYDAGKVNEKTRESVSEAQEMDLNNLPETVREQVRKTIQELELQKDERVLEFKESKNNK